MSDEIKESNTPNHILSALGDLTNGAINYYQLPKVTLKEQKMILDYITNLQTIEREYSSLLSENAELQQENDRLNEENKKFNKWIEALNKENHRLNEYNHLQSKIDKANQYLEERFIFDDENGEYYQTHTFDKSNAKELHDILKEE